MGRVLREPFSSFDFRINIFRIPLGPVAFLGTEGKYIGN